MLLGRFARLLLLIGLAGCLPAGQATPRPTASEVARIVPSATRPPPSLTPEPPTLTPPPAATPTASPTPEAPYPLISADSLRTGQSAYSFRLDSGGLVNFLLYVPGNYDPGVVWPLIVYLHGARGVGSNTEKLADEPLPLMLEGRAEWPFVVVSPQLPRGYWQFFLDPVDQMITYLGELLPTDEGRIYVTGFSLGGNGAWQYALRYPQRFAAAAPVAGVPSATSSSLPDNLCDLKHMPIWVFHSEADTVVSADQDVAAVEALEDCGGDVRFTRSTDLDHFETAAEAYNNPGLYTWFLEHTK